MTDFKFNDTQSPTASEHSAPPKSFILGRYLGGDPALDVRAGLVLCYLEQLKRHLLILGKTGKGKTTTARIFLEGLARTSEEAQIFFFDGNADSNMARMFGASLTAMGRSPRFFPQERFNAWPASDWVTVRNRLHEIIPFARQGDGSFYTSRAAVILFWACQMYGRPPTSLMDLHSRLNYGKIVAAFGPTALPGMEKEDVDNVRMRVFELYTYLGSSFDGEWSFKDVDSAYFSLDTLFLGKESIILAMRMLLAQLSYYISHEKPRDRPCVVIIDEFASFAGGVEVATFIEHARKLGVIVILMCQTVRGMGSPAETARVLDNPGIVLVHTTPEWHEIQHLISLNVVPELTLRNSRAVEEPDLRLVERPKVSKADILGLGVGEAWVFGDAKSMKIRMQQPDASALERALKSFRLPQQQDLFESVEYSGPEEAPPQELADQPEPKSWLDDRAETPQGRVAFQGSKFEIPPDFLEPQEEEKPAEDDNDDNTDGVDEVPVHHVESEMSDPPDDPATEDEEPAPDPPNGPATEDEEPATLPDPQDQGSQPKDGLTDEKPPQDDPSRHESDERDTSTPSGDAGADNDAPAEEIVTPEDEDASAGGFVGDQHTPVGGGLADIQIPAEFFNPGEDDNWPEDAVSDEEERLDEVSGDYMSQIKRLSSSEKEGASHEDEGM